MYTKKKLFLLLGSLVLMCFTFTQLTKRTFREMRKSVEENSSLSSRSEEKEVFKIPRKYQHCYNSTLDFDKFKVKIRKRFDHLQGKCNIFEKTRKSVHALQKHVLGRIIVSDKYRLIA